MDFRVVWLNGVVLGAAVVASCAAPDPGEITFSERPTDTSSGSSGQATSSGGTSSGGTSSGAADGGGSSGEGGTTKDPVFGTDAFDTNSAQAGPGQNANDVQQHKDANVVPVQGKNCYNAGAGCHGDAANGKPWGFAGTVYTSAAGTTTAKNVEVRVVNPDGTLFGSAYVDADGNFWYDSGGKKPAANSKSGVRNATKIMDMSGAPTDQCNNAGCHDANSKMRIYVQ